MMYLGDEKCQIAAEEIANRLLKTGRGDDSENRSRAGIRAELARLTRITEELSRPLEQEPSLQSLLKYARLVQQILRNPEAVNQEELHDSYQVAEVVLRIPTEILPESLAKTLDASRKKIIQLAGFPQYRHFNLKSQLSRIR